MKRKTFKESLADFGIGLGSAIVGPVAQALISFDTETLDSPGPWAAGLLAGCLVSAGLWLKTEYANRKAGN